MEFYLDKKKQKKVYSFHFKGLLAIEELLEADLTIRKLALADKCGILLDLSEVEIIASIPSSLKWEKALEANKNLYTQVPEAIISIDQESIYLDFLKVYWKDLSIKSSVFSKQELALHWLNSELTSSYFADSKSYDYTTLKALQN